MVTSLILSAPAKLEIRKNRTGEVVIYSTEVEVLMDGEGNYDLFYWQDGNMSCDCNRAIHFACALEKRIPWNAKCSEGKFSIRLTRVDSGKVIYDEFEEGKRTPFND